MKRAWKKEIPDEAKWSCYAIRVLASTGNVTFYFQFVFHIFRKLNLHEVRYWQVHLSVFM